MKPIFIEGRLKLRDDTGKSSPWRFSAPSIVVSPVIFLVGWEENKRESRTGISNTQSTRKLSQQGRKGPRTQVTLLVPIACYPLKVGMGRSPGLGGRNNGYSQAPQGSGWASAPGGWELPGWSPPEGWAILLL